MKEKEQNNLKAPYSEPQVEALELHLEGNLLTGSLENPDQY